MLTNYKNKGSLILLIVIYIYFAYGLLNNSDDSRILVLLF